MLLNDVMYYYLPFFKFNFSHANICLIYSTRLWIPSGIFNELVVHVKWDGIYQRHGSLVIIFFRGSSIDLGPEYVQRLSVLYLFPRKCFSFSMKIMTTTVDKVWSTTMHLGSFYIGKGLVGLSINSFK